MYKRYWLVSFYKNGFEGKMLVYGTEEDLQEYLNSEIGGALPGTTGNYRYIGATDKQVEAAKLLGIKAYLAPEAKRR